MSLTQRKVGDAHVSAIGYGFMGLSAFYGKVPPTEERLKIIDAVYESGVTFWDTADRYGDSEDLLGEWFKRTGKRNDIFLATKFGLGYPGRVVNGEPSYAHEAINNSLKRLGVDHVDLWYLHRPDPTVPIELTVGAMAEEVKAGKVKYLGLSECSADTLRRAHAVHPITALQVEYSPFTLDIEDPNIGLLNVARELGITIVAYSPLGRGLLTGKYKSPDDFEEGDFRRSVARYSHENFPNILKIVDGLKEIGARHGATPGQVALSWLFAQGDDVIPIPGTTRVSALKENVDALKVKLSPEEIKQVRELVAKADAAQGPRYPPGMHEVLFADTPPLKK
ncbi:Aldo/keto reductase [Obba rivulosa]|uniref:Aldo/keto reductase n=1 Tax=Obba rivulosa TaxID=1052685 RepID=A0A8E2DK62_9APHY|nr:Aldo/keto reductase [Obba rivulosa]